jgi:homoserine dehydrogenase
MKIGLFGFGCVGQGLWKVMHETRGIQAEIKRICIKNPEKQRSLPASYFSADPEWILNDPEIDVVVELIDDADAAFAIVSRALKSGKSVVSANKKMIAQHLAELYAIQEQTGASFLYEGACCASIPIIRNLEEYYDNDLLTSVEGIFNGTTNFILSKIFEEGLSFEEALSFAQKNGFAESDPKLDLEGYDSKFKLCILLLHAFGWFAKPETVFHYGINQLNGFDIDYAKKQGCSIKLLAKCYRKGDTVGAYCIPTFVPQGHRYSAVRNEYNAVTLESAFAEQQWFVGKGAGDRPTGCAVLSDISALRYQYKYEYRKYSQNGVRNICQKKEIQVYVRHQFEGQVKELDFQEITERYTANKTRYLIGRISLEQLLNAEWIRDEGVSVIEQVA